MANNQNQLCKAHSGFKNQIESLEEDVRSLWKRWDKMTMMLYAVLGGVILNLLILIGQHFVK